MKYYKFIWKKGCYKNYPRAGYEKIVHGPRGFQGIPGPKGDKGDKGDTGERGPSGEQIEVRSTQTLSSHEQAYVETFHKDNTTFLDFYIPRGYDAEPELVEAGKTMQVESTEPASVVDRYEDGIHYLDFSIPKGEKGATGDPGPKGENGATGPQGIAGPPGSTNNINITRYSTIEQQISTLTAFPLSEVATQNGITSTNDTITIPSNGVYILSFWCNMFDSVQATDFIGIYCNGTLITPTKRPLSNIVGASATIVYKLNKDDAITLQASLTKTSKLSNVNAPSAELTVIQIAE